MSDMPPVIASPRVLWDPLAEHTAADTNLVAAAKRREIRNILKSYVGYYDPLCELLQNAMDAVDARAAVEPLGSYAKHIWVTIDLAVNSVTVVDNGIGFDEESFKLFLSPNISFKDGRTTRGRKGVGATYLAYGFNSLTLGTRTQNYGETGEIVGGHRWVVDESESTPRPLVRQVMVEDAAFAAIDRGSIFRLRFGGEGTRPQNLSWSGATTADQWRYILLWKTPLGHVGTPMTAGADLVFDLKVIDREGHESSLTNQESCYLLPHTVIRSSLQLGELLDEQRRRIERQQDVSRLPARFYHQNGIYAFYAPDDLRTLLGGRSPDDLDVLLRHGGTAYAYFAYSTSVWDGLNDDAAKLRRGLRLLRGGLQLAAQHMPQGDEITIPLTSNIGYQKQVHVIVHFEEAEPDLGRKGFQPELRHAAEVVAVAIVNQLKKWRRHLKADSGAGAQIRQEGDLHAWITAQERHEAAEPLSFNHPEFFAPVHRVPITAVPQSEQDVIVLFSQLLAGGVVRGIRLLATSAHEQYDGVFRYIVELPLANHEFDEIRNPLGVESGRYAEAYGSRPYVLEYKYSVDGLVHEFESGDKHEGSVDLVVAWSMGSEWRKRYEVTSLLDLRHLPAREFHGQTHVFRDSDTGDVRFYGVILSELLTYLDNVQGAQPWQIATYDSSVAE